MACAYAKWTGRLGVCIATSGPGGIHLLNGLYDAKLDGQPVLAITGLQFHDLLHTYTQQDVELDKLFMDVAVYNARIMGRRTSKTSSSSPAARRWPIAASRMSPCRSTSSRRRPLSTIVRERNVRAPRLGRHGGVGADIAER